MHELNDVCGLAVQKTAQRFKILPGHALLIAELLQGGLAQQTFCADLVRIVALLLQCCQDIDRRCKV